MESKAISAKSIKRVLGLGIVSLIMFCSCGSMSGMSNQEAYDSGYAIGETIGRIISGN